jgi:preprotein translocase subunit SecD
MNRSWWYRFSFFVFVVILSTLAVIPTAFNTDPEGDFPVKSKINLGLDLQGGLYIVLGIDFNKVYRDEIQNYAKKVSDFAQDEDIQVQLGALKLDSLSDPHHTLEVATLAQVAELKELVTKYYPQTLRLTAENNTTLEYGLHRTFIETLEENAVSKSIEVIRNRIDEFGVTEPEIMSMGSDKIVVQLPGVVDIDRAKSLIGETAKLEFKFVSDQIDIATLQDWVSEAKANGIEFKKGDRFSLYVAKLNDYLRDKLPKGHELVFNKIVSKLDNEVKEILPYLVEQRADLTGEDLQDAVVQIDPQTNRPNVSITFKSQGAKIFADLTEKNVGRRMAIILDNNIYSDPVIQERIGGGRAQITLGAGNYNDMLGKAKDLALVLRAGALPVDLDFQEQRIVGPSLGADSIEKAKYAFMISCLLVFAFIIFYYKVSGIIAITTLVVNVLVVLACLVGLEATLTLPGIAGIALTIGMAVDANIIIYERIKEELKAGSAHLIAVESGFGKAFWTILDANLTTAVAGLCLINFGTGPIRGFAVTLLIGIMATVYCSYFVGRLIFEFYMSRIQGKKVSI